MLREQEFREYCAERWFAVVETENAVKAVKALDKFLDRKGGSFGSLTVGDVKEYIDVLIEDGTNTLENLNALARYVNLIDKKAVYIYFSSILGGRTVLPSISERLAMLEGEEVRDRVFEGLEAPPLGSSPDLFPRVTRELMSRLQSELGRGCIRVLAGNHHLIPVENFEKHKVWFEEAGGVDAFLKRMHDEAVAELEHYLEEDRVWFEQRITREVVEFVRGDQELLAGVRVGDWIYVTKFPYSPHEYLVEGDSLRKRYFMCHCPLAREAILMEGVDVPSMWCHCSGGFNKLKFDVVFGEETEVRVLDSALGGDMGCRFAIRIPERFR